MLQINNLTIGYYNKTLVENINLTINKGELILLCGANGCGKSTFFSTLMEKVTPLCGYINFNNLKPVYIPTYIPKLDGFTLLEFIKIGLYNEIVNINIINNYLNILNINKLKHNNIYTLSDGEFQKACICLALCRNADIILLDEPTTFLDVDNKIMVLNLLSNICKNFNKTILFSSHDVLLAYRYATRVLGINNKTKQMLDSNTLNNKQLVLYNCFNNIKAV